MAKRIKLYKNKPERLFVFGCSFTEYCWMTWANILALDLQVPFYNYAASGAGNRFIATRVGMADVKHKFTKNDLVIVCWTNVARIDRYDSTEDRWHLNGNIFNNENYSRKYLKKIDQTDLLLRDMAYIQPVHEMLKLKTNVHFLQMLDLSRWFDQQHETAHLGMDQRLKVDNKFLRFYKPALQEMRKSFYDTLWRDNLTWKVNWNKKHIHDLFWDTHPLPGEHYKFLTETFDYQMKETTKEYVKGVHDKTIGLVKKYMDIDPGKINQNLNWHQNEIIGPKGQRAGEII